MQSPPDRKRQEILAAAARLFATRAFHEVRVDDVAADARVSKGTVYLHFESKEDLYLSIVREGVAELVRGLKEKLASQTGPTVDFLREIIREMTRFAAGHPDVFKLLLAGKVPVDDERFNEADREALRVIESAIRRGVKRGELTDRRPAWTAQFVTGVICEMMKRATEPVDADALADHVMHVFFDGLRKR
jgi:AcrR family transcriptional regulator